MYNVNNLEIIGTDEASFVETVNSVTLNVPHCIINLVLRCIIEGSSVNFITDF